MRTHTLDAWRHEHVFPGDRRDENERRTWLVVGLTAVMMVVEIVGGTKTRQAPKVTDTDVRETAGLGTRH